MRSVIIVFLILAVGALSGCALLNALAGDPPETEEQTEAQKKDAELVGDLDALNRMSEENEADHDKGLIDDETFENTKAIIDTKITDKETEKAENAKKLRGGLAGLALMLLSWFLGKAGKQEGPVGIGAGLVRSGARLIKTIRG